MIDLGSEVQAFSRGGNRLCFSDPRDAGYCIKVPRLDRTPALKRAERGGLALLKPLRWFDDNYEEYQVFCRIERQVGEAAYQLIPRCLGFVETNLGAGLVTEMIRDADGKISITLKQYLWQFGFTSALEVAVLDFQQRWQALGIPSRNLLLHNIVVQCRGEQIQRLVVIDGLGWPDIIPLGYCCRWIARLKAARKARRLSQSIQSLLEHQRSGGDWGHHGWLELGQRQIDE